MRHTGETTIRLSNTFVARRNIRSMFRSSASSDSGDTDVQISIGTFAYNGLATLMPINKDYCDIH